MEQILSDFRRSRKKLLINFTVCAAAVWLIAWIPMIFSENWLTWVKVAWICIAAVLSAAAAFLYGRCLLETLFLVPQRLERQLKALPPDEYEQVISSYPNAKSLGERWFLPEHILFYTNRRVFVLRYDAIIRIVSLKDGDLRLCTSAGDIVMPVRAGENAAMIYALLHGRNPALKAEFEKRKG